MEQKSTAPEAQSSSTRERLEQTLNRIPPLDSTLAGRVRTCLDHLTKPRGSLGSLEELALRCVLITGQEHPQVISKVLFVCCADHGVCAEGVSAYPREVTAQMVYNFLRGGAAITVLARQLGITVQVVDLGVDHDFAPHLPGLIQRKIGRGTANLARGPAMTYTAAVQAVETGIALAERSSARRRATAGRRGDGDRQLHRCGSAALGVYWPCS